MGDSVLAQLNGPKMYLVCGGIVLFVAVVCVIFMVRAYRAGRRLGMDTAKMKRVMIFSATFTVLPAVGILLGVIALSGSLGTPWPWLRLSVIGALHYETQVAQAAAEQVGMAQLSGADMTAQAFVTIALLMSICIIWGMVLSLFFNRFYLKKLGRKKEDAPEQTAGSENASDGETAAAPAKKRSFGDIAMSAMFIGLVSAYLGSYIGGWVSGEGLFRFAGDLRPIIVALVSAAAMALFLWLSERKKAAWLDGFSVAASMILGMLAAILL